ncbi:polar amino acid transport system substrate-binding protein [Paracoccus aminovorans]|uniref:Polar amino acid transport system substrate-binding protein n=2 Tax=Paracoccus aminovorans TaxID=34004 RepID=A0A1I3BS00_9RHOB|nr:hypothetical protein JCM7685_1657 [Paracoccus aminovorans]SFH64960.1 polar amino acid transport system substrate-binding protein [Paracoccus aminovorans]
MANASIVCETAPGRFTGPVADLAARLAAALRLEARILPFASGGAILAEAGAWDIAVLAVDAARTQVRYVHEVAQVSATLAGRRGMSCREADRHSVRIATARGAAYETHLLGKLAQAEVISFDTPAAARDAMLAGVCDFAAGIRATLQSSLAGRADIHLMQDDFLTVSQALAVPAEHEEAALFLAKLLVP